MSDTPYTSSRPDYSSAALSDEETYWQGRPSQWLALDSWFLGGLFTFLAISLGALLLGELSQELNIPLPGAILVLGFFPMLLPIWKMLTIRFTLYQITNQRLFRKFGVFSTQTDEIELHRVRDYVVTEPLHLRVLGLGNLEVISVDRSLPSLTLLALRDPDGIRNLLRRAVSLRQGEVNWREVEVT